MNNRKLIFFLIMSVVCILSPTASNATNFELFELKERYFNTIKRSTCYSNYSEEEMLNLGWKMAFSESLFQEVEQEYYFLEYLQRILEKTECDIEEGEAKSNQEILSDIQNRLAKLDKNNIFNFQRFAGKRVLENIQSLYK